MRLASKLFLVAKISPKAEPKRALRPISCRGGARVSLGLLLGCCKIFRSSWAMNLLPAERLDKSSGRQADRQAWTSLQRSPASKKNAWKPEGRHLTSRTKVLSRSKKAICPGQKIADVPYKEIHPRNTVELSCSVRFYSTPFISSADLDQRSQQICSFVGCDEHGPDG